jgi:hypothetical protein
MPPRAPRKAAVMPDAAPTELTPLPAQHSPPLPAAMPAYLPMWPMPLLRAQKAQHLMQQVFVRGMSNQCGTACMLPLHADAHTWQEWWSIQQAIARRVLAQQQTLIDDLAGVAENYAELKLANTLSKFIAQEMNISADISAVVKNQMTGWANLLENIQVDYSYWLSQKHSHPY